MSPRPPAARASGFTLVEVMVVLALSAIVTLGIVAFYLSAQQTWTESSAQALAQRDATAVLEAMSRRVHESASALVDSANGTVYLFNPDMSERARFFLSGADSLIHYGEGGKLDLGPVAPTRVLRFQCSVIDTLGLLSVDTLRVLAASGTIVTLHSTMGTYNWTPK